MQPFTTLAQELPRVLARVRRAGVVEALAEDTALRILLRFHHRCGPAWLLRADDRTRLDALTALAITHHRHPPEADR